MNILSFRVTVPAVVDGVGPPIVFGEAEVLLQLPGPYISGIQVWTDELDQALVKTSEISLRLVEPPASRIFPEPSMTIMTPLIELPRAQAFNDGWYHIAPDFWTDFNIVVAGDQRYRVLCQFRNFGQGIITCIVNLKVSAKPPEETQIQLVKEMNAGIERWLSASDRLMRDTLQLAIQQGINIER